MIRLEAVTKVFPNSTAPAVDRLSLDIEAGDVVVLVGPSGCGKTTTLKMINRLVEPTSGTIEIDGRDARDMEAHELRRGIGYVIQQIGLFPHKTIADNIATVPRLLGWDKGRVAARVDELVALTDLDPEMRDRYPSELSGGQRQRVGVARALAADPPILLMDEPFGAVDPIIRARLQDELLDLQSRLNKTIVLVTHDIDEAIKLGDRVAILNVGGILEQYGPPGAILRDPANEFVSGVLGSDRGLKRLSLIPVSAIELDPGPVLAPDATPDEAREVMGHYGIDWFAVRDEEHGLRWAPESDLASASSTGAVATRPFLDRLHPDSTLRDALDAVVGSHTRVAAVFDGGGYVGMVTLDRISREILQ